MPSKLSTWRWCMFFTGNHMHVQLLFTPAVNAASIGSFFPLCRRGVSGASIGVSPQLSLAWPLMQVNTDALHLLTALRDCMRPALIVPDRSDWCYWIPSRRFLLLHLRHPEEPRLEAFPRAAGPPLLRQPRRSRPQTARQPALRRRRRRRRSDYIVSAVSNWRQWCRCWQ